MQFSSQGHITESGKGRKEILRHAYAAVPLGKKNKDKEQNAKTGKNTVRGILASEKVFIPVNIENLV